jgi:hypothetical protein
MNEAEFIDEHAADVAPEVEQEDAAEESNLSATDQTAFDQGWRPKEEFKGDPDNWKTSKEYIKDGEFISKIADLNRRMDSQKADFDERLENTNKLNEARRKSEIEDLKAKQREAINMADEDAYDRAQKKIDTLEDSKADTDDQPQAKDPAITEWEAKNDWINNPNDEKTAIAQSIFNNYVGKNQGHTAKQALDHVDARLANLYPVSNPRRDQPDSTESGTKRPKQKNRDLSMDDLTQDEKQEWNQYGQLMFKDQKSFLKAVSDTRKKS